MFLVLADHHGQTFLGVGQHGGNAEFVLNGKDGTAESVAGTVELEIQIAHVAEHIQQEHRVVHIILTDAGQVDDHGEMNVGVIPVLGGDTVFDPDELDPVFPIHGHQIHHGHDVQGFDAAQHGMAHTLQILAHIQLGEKGGLGRDAVFGVLLDVAGVGTFYHQVIIDGLFQIFRGLDAVILLQGLHTFGRTLGDNTMGNAAHDGLFTFCAGELAAQPLADVGHIIGQGRSQGGVLQRSRMHQHFQNSAESVFLFHGASSF